ncbi:MAG TPA: hypothetical protein VE090_03730 [Methylomirabilota bacterium]|nr:hypothetical protein [Methylomirabilota bacterium]
MDFDMLKKFVSKDVVVDTEHANPHELRVNYKPGDESCWLIFVPQNYRDEVELAAVIRIEIEKKRTNNATHPPLSSF